MNNKIQSAFAEIYADEALLNSTAAYVQKRRRAFRPGLLIAALLVLLAPVYVYSQYFAPAAYVSIDVNPSLELTLNRKDKVIATYAFNNDGQHVLGEVSLRGKSYDEATGLLLSTLQADGYLRDQVVVSVSVQTANNKRQQLLCSSLQQLIRENLEDVSVNAKIDVFPVSAEIWSNAHSCHMSPAKYMALQEAPAMDEQRHRHGGGHHGLK